MTTILTTGGMAGKLALLLAASAITGVELAPHKPKPARIFTHADEERIAKAEAKRARKAAKRLKGEQA